MVNLGDDSNRTTPPLWLVLFTLAVYMGFLIAYGTSLPSVNISDCTSNPGLLGVNCISAVWSFIGLLFSILTLGGTNSPLPVLYVQGPLVLFFAITWGYLIVQNIMKLLEILAEAVP